MWIVDFIFWLATIGVAYYLGLRQGHKVGAQRILNEWRNWIDEQR